MNDVDCWIYFDGPEPPLVRPLLDALRAPPPVAPEDMDRVVRALLHRLDATRSPGSSTVSVPPRAAEPSWPPPAPSPPPDVERRHSLQAIEAEDAPPAPPAGPVYKRPPAALQSTALAPDRSAAEWQARGKLPFQPAPPPGTALPAPRAVKTMPVRVVPSDLRETFPLGTEAPWKPIAALPFAGSPANDGIVTFPSLTVKQYVSLRADLAAKPAKERAATLLAYGVPTEASLLALLDHWQAELAARPELRAETDAAAAEYATWMLTVPR